MANLECRFAGLLIVSVLGIGPLRADAPWDMTPPGDVPEIFAPGIVSLENRYEQNMSISPDWSEIYFTVTDAGWTACHVVALTFDGAWGPLDTGGLFNPTCYETEPRLSPDGKRLCFVSTRPQTKLNEDGSGGALWVTERNSKGWHAPRKLSLPEQSWHPSLTADHQLYFLSFAEGGHGDGDIYSANLTADGITDIANAGPAINTPAADADPFISPDGNLLIFDSTREGGYGAWDLYVSFKDDDGIWSQPVNLGDKINTSHVEFGASLSPDGKYLFFSRRSTDNQQGDVYWVSAGILDEMRDALKSSASAKETISPPLPGK